eukprot:CAMPEP_0119012506 /NCGR_PEP_ID=MMETSP1176-20130426/6821_1 /TAXON_ID=265551 /ORGANISM="Synedropsis recta cf, Strain CCMP1620" /LENGTH=394 /DNA_ID=CAMNT_0006965485 /DNA_START=36 /DNA_END=1220 /DNA_ORIENTATION=+
MKMTSQIFTLFGLSLLLASPRRTVLAADDEERSSKSAGSSSSSDDEDTDRCGRVSPLPIFAGNGTEASYGTFVDGIGNMKEATYSNLAEEYFERMDSIPYGVSLIDAPQDFGDFYLLPLTRKSAGEDADTVIYSPEGKYVIFPLGRLRAWHITVNPTPPVEILPPREVLESSFDESGQYNFMKYHIGTSLIDFQLDQIYAGTYDDNPDLKEVFYTTEHNLVASDLSLYLERTATATVDGCEIPDAISYLTKSQAYPPRITDLENAAEEFPATLKSVTGWFMILPPLTPGLHYIEGMTYNAKFQPPDTIYPADFEREDAHTFNVCVGDPSGCVVDKEGGGSKKDSKGNRGKRNLRETSSTKNGPRGTRSVETPERELTVIPGLLFTETGYDHKNN